MERVVAQNLRQPRAGLRSKGGYRPAVFVVLFNKQPVGLCRIFEPLVMIIAVVAHVLDTVVEVVEVGHFVEHGAAYFRHGAVEMY